ncbi:MAG: hypothetical protein HYS17_06075 [Micavibrio aeruginosavorus]|uniref:Uncharacterized protein n=1 Tax=Micavibrio aeruginosavorus TaxID=349221 RepID=A0A7T5UGB3_9BACT|nr:MAG: hypothetical protein HYS17_06075 [Micavibrio aeruginosavorus]
MALKKLAFSLQSGVHLCVVTVGFAAAMSLSSLSFAQTSCDPQYMDALESRAYLEAQREVAMNQNLILKPDSVLEYSCFDEIMGTLARAPGNRDNFSESNRWGAVPGHDDRSLDNAFDAVVSAALNPYLTSNFSHTFLGGRTGTDHTLETVNATAGAYNCGNMAAVWNLARCMNFNDRPAQDFFFDFDYLKGNPDKVRLLPASACTDSGITQQWIDQAFNNESSRYVLAAENNPLDGVFYTKDSMNSYLDRINPYGVAPATVCAAGIPTGVVVYRQGSAPEYYYEKVCPNPGCYYVPSGAGTQAAPSNTGNCQN